MNVVPEPDADDIPINEPLSAEIGGQQRAKFKWELTQNVSEVLLPVVAATKYSQSSYKVTLDGGSAEYGPREVPPTELDDKAVCFLPARSFSQKLEVEVTNLRDSDTSPRTYHVQPIGWEKNSE